MDDKKIEQIYNIVKEFHSKYLKKHNVKLPKLKIKNKYTKDALCLVYLTQGYPKTKVISKQELTRFIRKFYPNTNDVQQARHLATQKGWFILSGTRGDINSNLKSGEYKLITLKTHYPKFRHQFNNKISSKDWETIKKKYNYRCATCGSKEGEEHYVYKNTITKLQKAHKDPNKPLNSKNIIPQCQKCNRADKNNWIYDNNGRVVGIANANIIKKTKKDIRKKIYQILKEEFSEHK